MAFSEGTITLQATMMIIALLALTTVNALRDESLCKDDQDCGPDKYCYNVSGTCVEYTKCNRFRRLEASTPARNPTQCGPCRPGYKEEVLGTGVPAESCTKFTIMGTQQPEPETENVVTWPWIWGICISVAVILLGLAVFHLLKYVRTNGSARLIEKVPFLNAARPTAPPQDEASYRLRGPSYPDIDSPPIYSPPVAFSVDKSNLVNATPSNHPNWVNKPNYDPDYNDNIADGVAMPIRSSSTNIQMDLDNLDEGETNPSPWTPEQQEAIDVPTRPFARFATGQQENEVSSALVRTNYRSNSTSSDNMTSGDRPEQSESPSGSRAQGDIYCAPNVHINQTINLNIAQSVRK